VLNSTWNNNGSFLFDNWNILGNSKPFHSDFSNTIKSLCIINTITLNLSNIWINPCHNRPILLFLLIFPVFTVSYARDKLKTGRGIHNVNRVNRYTILLEELSKITYLTNYLTCICWVALDFKKNPSCYNFKSLIFNDCFQ
jgi:hypothetical protein